MRPRTAAACLLAFAAVASAEETTGSWDAWCRTRSEELERMGQFEDAIEELLCLARLHPGDVAPLSRAAVLAVDAPQIRGKELRKGTPAFALVEQCVREAVTRWGHGDAGLAYVIGRMKFAEGNWATAWKMFGQARDTGFDPAIARFWHYRAAVNRAAMQIDAGRLQDAIDDLDGLLRALPGHPDEDSLLINLAAAHHRFQEPDVALALLKRVLDRSPERSEAHYLWGVVLAEQGKLDESLNRLREAMSRAPATPDSRTYRDALLKIIDVQIKLDKVDDAEASANQYLAIAKDSPEGIYARGRVRQAKNDLDGALLDFRRAARMLPDSVDTLVNLKQTLHLLGENDEADAVGRRIDAIRRRRNRDLSGEPGTMDGAPRGESMDPARRTDNERPPEQDSPPPETR